MGVHRADDHRRTVLLDALQLGDAGDIDQRTRVGEPQLHRADEALSAGECLAAGLGERRGGVGDRFGALVFECVHGQLLNKAVDYCLAAWSACHTRCGVAGMSRYFTPDAASASCTAFISAAGAPIAPASPQPFAPSGLWVHAVTLVATLNAGRSSERGMA